MKGLIGPTMDETGLKSRMQERIARLGITRDELAERTGDSPDSVKNWLGRKTVVPASFVARFAAAVPVNLEWLIFGAGSPEPTPPEKAATALGMVREVLEAAQSDDDEFQRFYSYWLAFRQFLREEGEEPGEGAA